MESGRDVKAIQRALQAAKVLNPGTSKPTVYAEATWNAVTRFQKMNKIQPTGHYGKPTHLKLAKYFDVYGRWLLNEAAADLQFNEVEKQRRQRVVQAAFFYYSERYQLGYSQARPIPTVYYGTHPPELPRSLDCSGLAITCYWVPGLIGYLGLRNMGGYGNTWSLDDYGTQISVPELRLGDLTFYGNLSHVAIYVGGGRVISHGSAAGPLLLPYNYRPLTKCRSYLP